MFQALGHLPILFGSAMVLLSALQLLWVWLSMVSGLPSPFVSSVVILSPSDLSGMALLSAGVSVVAAWVQAPVAVSVHRYVLLAEVQDRVAVPATSRDRRFALWLIAVGLLAESPRLLQVVLVGHPWLSFAVSVPLLITIAILSLRLALLFPAVALDEVDALSRGWHLSRGHTWRILWTGSVVCLPIAIPTILGFVLLQGHFKQAVICLTTSLSMTFSIGALAAMASIYFRLTETLPSVPATRPTR